MNLTRPTRSLHALSRQVLLGFALLAMTLTTLAAPPDRVVFQISDADPASWSQALNNVRNVQQMLGKDKVAVEIVIFGNGIGAARFDSPINERIGETIAAGVDVVVCENTLKAKKLSPDDMHAKVRYVPAGVVEIMRKQQEGWAYIRP